MRNVIVAMACFTITGAAWAGPDGGYRIDKNFTGGFPIDIFKQGQSFLIDTGKDARSASALHQLNRVARLPLSGGQACKNTREFVADSFHPARTCITLTRDGENAYLLTEVRTETGFNLARAMHNAEEMKASGKPLIFIEGDKSYRRTRSARLSLTDGACEATFVSSRNDNLDGTVDADSPNRRLACEVIGVSVR
jgi:hypothetical protein